MDSAHHEPVARQSWLDDKHQVIACATVIALAAMIFLPKDGALQIAGNVVSGLFGVAVGRAIK